MILNVNTENPEKELELLGGMSMELIWENESPTSGFRAQKIGFILSENDKVGIVCIHATAVQRRTPLQICNNGEYTNLNSGLQSIVSRAVYISTTGADFAIGAEEQISAGYNESENHLIPYQIYIIKGAN